eukprot:12814392-Alexandrium_andersonii.AAC.1
MRTRCGGWSATSSSGAVNIRVLRCRVVAGLRQRTSRAVLPQETHVNQFELIGKLSPGGRHRQA